MGIKSGGYNATLPEQRPFKYWAQLAAIRRVMRDASDPATVLDALFEPMSPTQTATDGNAFTHHAASEAGNEHTTARV